MRRDTNDDDVVKLAFHDFRRVFATVTGWDKPSLVAELWGRYLGDLRERKVKWTAVTDLAMDNFNIPTCLRDCGAACVGARWA